MPDLLGADDSAPSNFLQVRFEEMTPGTGRYGPLETPRSGWFREFQYRKLLIAASDRPFSDLLELQSPLRGRARASRITAVVEKLGEGGLVVVNEWKTRACAALKFPPAEALGCKVGTSL